MKSFFLSLIAKDKKVDIEAALPYEIVMLWPSEETSSAIMDIKTEIYGILWHEIKLPISCVWFGDLFKLEQELPENKDEDLLILLEKCLEEELFKEENSTKDGLKRVAVSSWWMYGKFSSEDLKCFDTEKLLEDNFESSNFRLNKSQIRESNRLLWIPKQGVKF